MRLAGTQIFFTPIKSLGFQVNRKSFHVYNALSHCTSHHRINVRSLPLMYPISTTGSLHELENNDTSLYLRRLWLRSVAVVELVCFSFILAHISSWIILFIYL